VSNENGNWYFVKDALGSVTDIMNESGIKVQRYTYSSFGKLVSIKDQAGNDVSENPVLEPFLTYTGREFDREVELYHYRSRTYDAQTGRFMQNDANEGFQLNPISFLSKYIYVQNNAQNLIDPSGDVPEAPPIYGHYCGPSAYGKNWTKDPKNKVDAACRRHDKGYADAENFESKWNQDNGHFAPELAFAEDTYHYFAHRGIADAKLVLELNFNPENWKDENGNFSAEQFVTAKLISAYFVYKYYEGAFGGASVFDVGSYQSDKKFLVQRYQFKKIKQLQAIKL
jgi:RHS repeat-associated protein